MSDLCVSIVFMTIALLQLSFLFFVQRILLAHRPTLTTVVLASGVVYNLQVSYQN